MRRRCTTVAPIMMMASPVPARAVRIGAMPVSCGTTRPMAPITSSAAMALMLPAEKSSVHAMPRSARVAFGVTSFMRPPPNMARASRPLTIQSAMSILGSVLCLCYDQ